MIGQRPWIPGQARNDGNKDMRASKKMNEVKSGFPPEFAPNSIRGGNDDEERYPPL
jgi:hypothetical protein